eukprot:GILI01011447.1.p1 GENE.GILI01011447.1~~GILI01011447.1.p1  ORF type:complete len:552 (-),score=62.68 GILI01011447.1:55-1674(-)
MTAKRPQVDQTWIKNHPLEGDGLITGFYNFLFKRNTKTLKPCKDVFIPDTIVFDHNFPRGWYTSDLKAKEISKKQGKELDAASIANTFCDMPNHDVKIVASYMSSFEIENDHGVSEVCTEVEFFNESTLKEFVARKTKREGILQRFLIPKGHRNSVIQAVWSPLIFACKRRTNTGSITDKIQCEKDPYPVAVTYEGPSHFSEESSCAPETTAQIKDICKHIVEHFYNTEHKHITRMVLYFKVDERNQLWLLWCGSLRVSEFGNKSQMPVNLAAMFTSPSLQAGSPTRDDKLLREADMKHLAMTNDVIFYETYVRNGGAHAAASSVRQANADSATSHTLDDRKEKKKESKANAADGEAWKSAPGIQDQYRELCAERELVLGALEDIFYEAYGHFLRHDPGPFRFEVPRKVAQTITEEKLQELMKRQKIDQVITSEDASDNDELWFSIPANNRAPVSRMGDEAAKWVEEHYNKKEQELRDEALSMPRTLPPVAPAPTAIETKPAPSAPSRSPSPSESGDQKRDSQKSSRSATPTENNNGEN